MQETIEILSVEKREGIGRKSLSAYSMIVCQCVLHDDDGVHVGELILPKGMAAPKPGRYTARYKPAVDYEKRFEGRLVELLPAVAVPAVSPRAA